MKLKVNDTVKITLGKDSGKTSKIERVIPSKNLVAVTGINVFKKHFKSRDQKQPSSIIDITKPLHASKVALICPHCNLITRVGFQGVGSKKIRICKKCKKPLDSKPVKSDKKK